MASSSGDGSKDTSDIPRGLINRMGNPIGRGSRLPSVRGHRDLTLGGKQRKVFTPNLAAVKKTVIKDDAPKELSVPISSKSSKADQRGRGKYERGRGRGRGRGEDRTIQLQSEFAFGPMGGQSSGSSKGRLGGGGGGGGGGGRGARHSDDNISLKMSLKQNPYTEDNKRFLDPLMRDDFLSDISCGDPHMKPIRLPLGCVDFSVKQEIKTEPKEEMMDTDGTSDTKTEASTTQHGFSANQKVKSEPPLNIKELIMDASKSDKGELIFLHFPDTLPGCPPVTDDRPKASTSTSKEDELSKQLSLCQLKDCSEGFVGKLRIRKSGRAELVLGENIMDVLPGLPVNFHQELVSVHTDGNSGQMVVLGQVNHKLVVAPDYDSLLQQTDRFG